MLELKEQMQGNHHASFAFFVHKGSGNFATFAAVRFR